MINELYDIALEYVKKHNLNNYLKEIRFVNEKNTILNKNYIAFYNFEDKFIEFNLDRINKDELYALNSKILIYHELTHVKQNKIRIEENSPEKKLYEYDFNLVENDYTYYMKNHDKFVIEYNARIESYINAMNNSDYDLSDSIYDNINFYYDNESLLKIYKDKNYLLILKNIIKECNYEDSKKILLGLPIEENTKIKIKEYEPTFLYYVSKNI